MEEIISGGSTIENINEQKGKKLSSEYIKEKKIKNSFQYLLLNLGHMSDNIDKGIFC